MAVVGEAFIIIKPITAGFEGAVSRDLKKVEGVAGAAGGRAGRNFSRSFQRYTDELRGPKTLFDPKAVGEATRAFYRLQAAGFAVQTGLSILGSTLGSVISAVVALGGAAIGAVPSVAALGGAFVSLGVGLAVAKLALSGVGQAVQKLNKQQQKAQDLTAQNRRIEDAERALERVRQQNKEALARATRDVEDATTDLTNAQTDLTKALFDGNEQLQQLNFDAEDAALAEQKAANELEDARKTLARVQDLPPNSRARREAELAYRQADLNLRRAKDKNSDLAKEQERLAKTGVEGLDSVISARAAEQQAQRKLQDTQDARTKAERDAAQKEEDALRDRKRAYEDLEKAKTGGTGAQDPLAGLTESQKTFAKFIAGLKPKFDELKEAAAAAFLPLLQQAIQMIVDKAWPTLKTGIAEVGTALGNAAVKIATAITETKNLEKLSKVFTNSAKNIETMGDILANVYGIFLSVLIAIQPLTDRFLTWIEKTTKKWDDFLNTEKGAKQLEEFFNTAGDVAAKFGGLFKETFGALGTIVKANIGPGSGGYYIIDWLTDVMKGFKEVNSTAEGQKSLKEFFLESSKNAVAAFSAIGKFIGVILKAGADPAVKEFWDIIGSGAKYFENIMTESNKAGPALARLIVSLLKLLDVVTSSGAMTMFFNTLNFAVSLFASIMGSKVVQAILKVTAPLHGFFVAWFILKPLLIFIANVALGILINVLSKLGLVIRIVVGAVRLLSAAFAANPVGVIIVAITALIALFVVLYNKNEAFREFVQKAWAAIKDAVKAVVDWFVEWLPKIWDGIKDGLQAAWDAVKVIWDLIVAGVKLYIKAVTAVIEFVWDVLTTALDAAWTAIQKVWDLIVAGVKLYIKAVTTVIEFIWDVLKTGLEAAWTAIQFVWDLIVAGVKLYIDAVTAAIKFVWDVLKTALDAVWTGIQFVWDLIIKGVTGYIATVKGIIEFVWNVLKTGLDAAWNAVKGVWNTITSGVSGFVSGVKNTIGNIWEGLTSGLKGAWELAKKWWNDNVASKKLTIGGFEVFGKKLPSFDIGFPRLAQGGTVMPRAGGTIAQLAEAGRPERVEPLDPDGLSKRDKAMINMLTKGGTAGATFNIYPSEGMDEVELAALISRQIAFQNRKGVA